MVGCKVYHMHHTNNGLTVVYMLFIYTYIQCYTCTYYNIGDSITTYKFAIYNIRVCVDTDVHGALKRMQELKLRLEYLCHSVCTHSSLPRTFKSLRVISIYTPDICGVSVDFSFAPKETVTLIKS